MTIYIDTPLSQDLQRQIVKATKGDICVFKTDLPTEEDRMNAIQNANIIFGNPKPATVLHEARQLKWFQLGSAGFEYYRDINTTATVTNMQDFFSVPCAETMMAGILALYRGIDRFVDLKQTQHWVGHNIRPELFLLSHKKVLILGAGSIGKALAKMLKGFGCTVFFYARKKRKGVVTTIEAVEKLIPEMDIIVGCLPGTAETKGFFTPKMIDLMQSNALFCNVGRGNLVADEGALITALQQRKIGGAVLDVTKNEPIPSNHPLWDCPNTILTQHSGGGNTEEIQGMVNVFLQNYERFKQGQPLMNIVQLDRGY
jgi:glyoxylate/hydroxypyruvate reductase